MEEDRVCQAGPHLSPTAMLLISCMTILSLKFLTCKIKLPTSKIVMEYGKLNKDLFLLNPFLLSSQPTDCALILIYLVHRKESIITMYVSLQPSFVKIPGSIYQQQKLT